MCCGFEKLKKKYDAVERALKCWSRTIFKLLSGDALRKVRTLMNEDRG